MPAYNVKGAEQSSFHKHTGQKDLGHGVSQLQYYVDTTFNLSTEKVCVGWEKRVKDSILKPTPSRLFWFKHIQNVHADIVMI